MHRQVNPVVAAVIIAAVVIIVGYVAWRATLPQLPRDHISGMARVRQSEVRQRLMQNYQQRWMGSTEKHQ